MTTKRYEFFCDPGHGWMRVPLVELEAFRLLDDITGYSYLKSDWAYLEEDVDMGRFVSRLKAHDIWPEYTEILSAISRVRHYDRYSANAARKRLQDQRWLKLQAEAEAGARVEGELALF